MQKVLVLFTVLVLFVTGCGIKKDNAVAVFSYEADETGFYDVVFEYENPGEEGTLGLFVNDHFFMKVVFPSGEGTVTERITLKEGKGTIKFYCLPGDGNIKVNGYTSTPSAHKISLVIAPHEDDEIFGFAGTIRQLVEAGDTVKVVYLTTGDFFDKDLGPVRIRESINALAHLGVDRSDIIYMGYGDFIIEALYDCDDPDAVFDSIIGYCATYGDPESNIYDYHTLDTGSPADYNYTNFRTDLYNVIDTIRPDSIYTTSEYEWHSDHKYAYIVVREIVEELNREDGYHTRLCQTVIHGEDYSWPGTLDFDDNGDPILVEFTNPFPTTEIDLNWDDAVKVTLSDEDAMEKFAAINEFYTQNYGGDNFSGAIDFNYAFCRRDEFYWVCEY